MPASPLPAIVLASSSSYRRELLARLQLPFESLSPDCDEKRQAGESVAAMAARLATDKAAAVAAKLATPALVIGSDQVASVGEEVLGKPGTIDNARRQLRLCSGKRMQLHTAMTVLDTRSQSRQDALVLCTVDFRELSDAMIEHYLAREAALDCAGSLKIEGLGISLLKKIDCEDPTAIIGLPLIALSSALEACGVRLPPEN